MSTILSADDLNDFITPGVACIKPVEVLKTSKTAEIVIGDDGKLMEEGQSLQAAQISLQDCLACSGCITSSEAMLVELHSPKEMLKQLEQNYDTKVFIASICHQTRVSFAKAFNLPIEIVDSKLNWYFVKKLGFQCVIGTEVGRILSLHETWLELVENKASRPILSSICPGWTLYAEKTHPEILQYLSHVKSPQQLTGRLIKQLIAQQNNMHTSEIYHVSVMPCFDKKLESSRPGYEFADHGREVDLVVTAKELIDLFNNTLQISFENFGTLNTSEINYPTGWPVADQFKSNAGSSSGGYLHFALNMAAKTAGANSEIISKIGKNRDYVEYSVISDGSLVFKGAQVYGFRNIQNVVRKLKMKSRPAKAVGNSKKSSDIMEFNYIELMACPGGCVNGGGQIGSIANMPSHVWVEEMDKIYATIPQLQLTDDIFQQYSQQIGVTQDSCWTRTEHKPVVRDTSLPTALSIGTSW